MSTDYRPPEEYVNPVPESGSSVSKLKRARDVATTPIPWTSSISGFGFVRLAIMLIGVAVVLAGPIRHAVGSLPMFAQLEGSVAADGNIGMGAGEVTAHYTPSGKERVSEGPHNAEEFTGQEWTLWQGREKISVRDYHFASSPVADRATREDYYAASERELFMNAGHEVKPEPITRGGRDGRIWRISADGGGWLVLAEFPGDPVTVRIRCSSDTRETTVAEQCMQVIDSLQIR